MAGGWGERRVGPEIRGGRLKSPRRDGDEARVARRQTAMGFSAHARTGFLFAFPGRPFSFSPHRMSNFDSDGGPESEWDDRGELAWNEFDWERYLREQDEAIHRYLRFYESAKDSADRID